MSKILWLFKMSGTFEEIKHKALDADINPTATNMTLPTMPLNDGSSDIFTIPNLMEFMKTLSQFESCSREYDGNTKELALVYYDKIHNGCKVIISLKRAVITIKHFLHGYVKKNVDHTFDSIGFQKYVTPFLTHAELEKQKRFDDLQVQQKKLMAEQLKLKKQEEERLDQELTNAHVSKPQTCGGVDICKICKQNQAMISLANFHTPRFVCRGT